MVAVLSERYDGIDPALRTERRLVIVDPLFDFRDRERLQAIKASAFLCVFQLQPVARRRCVADSQIVWRIDAAVVVLLEERRHGQRFCFLHPPILKLAETVVALEYDGCRFQRDRILASKLKLALALDFYQAFSAIRACHVIGHRICCRMVL